MRAVNIEWETDGEEVVLPTEIELPDWIEEDDWDEIDDYLSDKTGFLHNGYQIDR